MATSKPSGTNCPKSSFRSTAHPSKREVRKQQHKLQAKAKQKSKQKAKKTRSDDQTSEPEVSHSQHVKSISSKTKRTKGQKVKRSKRPKEVKPVPSKSTKGATAPPQPQTKRSPTKQVQSQSQRQSGGYSGGVPPLPIPNREVKPARANGTAHECGRVGCRPLQTSRPPADSSAGGRFFCAPAMALNQHVTSDFI